MGMDPSVKRHFSGLRTAQMIEDLLELRDYELLEPNIAIAEETEANKLVANAQEDVFAMQQTPSPFEPPNLPPVQ
jgi:hypothetical protein